MFILFSFLEHQLDSLCELFARTQGLNIVHTDLRDRDIDRSRRYLRKVIRLQLDDNSTDWHEIKKVQKVRNVLVHENGRLIDDAAIKIVNESDYLSRVNESNYERAIDEVNILEGYLPFVLDTFSSYCREVNEAIEV